MIKRISGLKIELNNLTLVTEKNGIKIYHTNKYYYVLNFKDLITNKQRYKLLKGKELDNIAIEYGFQVQQFHKVSNYIHAALTDIELQRLETYKSKYNLNTSKAIKKLIASI